MPPEQRRTSTFSASRIVPGEPTEIWALISEPTRRAEWWPGIDRVEITAEDRWTEVVHTRRGKAMRLDYHLLASDPPYRLLWEQELVGSPFGHVLSELRTELVIEPRSDGSVVTIAQQQKLRGYSRTGSLLIARSQKQRLARVLDALAAAV